ncbi:MAG: RDD family protein [Clostridia bacterium]|nr:RDD family protein [Clostridia bacterium]
MRKVLEVLTPENVYVEYELAGVGSRCIALLIDSLIQGAMVILVLIGISLSGIGFIGSGDVGDSRLSVIVAISIVVLFVILFGYFIFFEIIMNGQTPGKKLMKLKVIKQSGEPIGYWECVLRNILRIADMLPSAYLAGALFILFSKNYKRLGDFAANTIVVRVKKETKITTIESLIKKSDAEFEETQIVNIYPVNNFEYGILKEFLERKENLGTRRPIFAFHLNKYFMEKFNIQTPFEDPYEFFKDIVRMNSGI